MGILDIQPQSQVTELPKLNVSGSNPDTRSEGIPRQTNPSWAANIIERSLR